MITSAASEPLLLGAGFDLHSVLGKDRAPRRFSSRVASIVFTCARSASPDRVISHPYAILAVLVDEPFEEEEPLQPALQALLGSIISPIVYRNVTDVAIILEPLLNQEPSEPRRVERTWTGPFALALIPSCVGGTFWHAVAPVKDGATAFIGGS